MQECEECNLRNLSPRDINVIHPNCWSRGRKLRECQQVPQEYNKYLLVVPELGSELDTGEKQVQGYPGLHSECQASIGSRVRPNLKTKKREKKYVSQQTRNRRELLGLTGKPMVKITYGEIRIPPPSMIGIGHRHPCLHFCSYVLAILAHAIQQRRY